MQVVHFTNHAFSRHAFRRLFIRQMSASCQWHWHDKYNTKKHQEKEWIWQTHPEEKTNKKKQKEKVYEKKKNISVDVCPLFNWLVDNIWWTFLVAFFDRRLINVHRDTFSSAQALQTLEPKKLDFSQNFVENVTWTFFLHIWNIVKALQGKN